MSLLLLLTGSAGGGGTTANAQIAAGTFAGVAGTPTPGGSSASGQAGAATFAAIAGVATPGGITVAAQVAAAAFTGVAGTSTPGGTSTGAQVATAAFGGVAGSPSTGGSGPQSVTAQVAAASFAGVAGTPTPGGLTRTMQVAAAAFSAAAAQHGNALTTYQGADVFPFAAGKIENIAAVDALRDDFEIVVKVQVDARARKPPGPGVNVMGLKAGAICRVYLTPTTVTLWINDGASNLSVNPTVGFASNQTDGSTPIWLRVQHSGGIAKFWTAPATTDVGEPEPVGGAWTQMGADRPFVKTISSGSNGVPHSFMGYGYGANENGGGHMYRAIARDAPGGTTLFDIDFSRQRPGTLTFTEAISGKTVTAGVAPGATITMNPITAVTVQAQVATASLNGIAGTLLPGAVSKPAQVATAVFAAVAGAFAVVISGGHGTATIMPIGTATAGVVLVREGSADLVAIGAASVITTQPDSAAQQLAGVGAATAEVTQT